MARIPALEPPFTPDVEAQLATMMPAGMPPIGLFRTFAKNLPMTVAMSNWGRYELGRDLSLTLREREVVILRTCARCGCEYEWGVHVQIFAEAAGLTSQEISATAYAGSEAPLWTPAERALLQAVEALHARATLSDAEFDALRAHYDEAKIFEVLLLCGFYRMVAYVANGLDLPLEPDAARFPLRNWA